MPQKTEREDTPPEADTEEEPRPAALAEKIEKGNDKRPAEILRDTVYAYETHFALALRGSDGKPLIDSGKFVRIAYTAIRKSEKLQQASVPSLMGALMLCAQLGLEPSGPLGHAYLVPFYDSKQKAYEVQLILGYQGMVQLAMRSGMVASISARVVHEGDRFEWEYGSNEYIRHVPTDEPGPVTHVYAIARLVTGGQPMVVLTKAEVDAIKARSKAKDEGPWKTDYEAMARKTAVRQLFRWIPSSVETRGALGADGGTLKQIPESLEDLDDPDVIDVEGEET